MTSILYLSSVDLPHRKARAIQIVNTAHALARAGAWVTLVGGRRDPGDASSVLMPFGLQPHPRLRVVRVPIARPPAKLDRWYTSTWQASYLGGLALRAFRLMRPLPDAIVVRDLRLAWLLCQLSRNVRQRLVYEVHDLSSLEAELRGESQEASRIKDLEDFVFSRVGRVVCITSELKRLLAERNGRPAESIVVIPDGTNAPREEAGGVRRREGVYYVGQLYPWKGVDTLIRAAVAYPQAEYVLVGGTEEPGADEPDIQRLTQLARDLGIAGRVRFTGWVPYRDVSRLLRDAAVTVIPLPDTAFGRYFTSPLKLFDYMAAGAAIVSSDLPSLRDVLKNECNALLVPPGDPSALAQAIQRLLSDESLAVRLGKQARLDVQRYSWDARAARLLDQVSRTPVPLC
ncbi:MAG TPA: glycosyltransferase family 4 protein [Chloroflexota bacterium]|nr:glycosyltransferase family 4 protein [Chloroflexota bacterium]